MNVTAQKKETNAMQQDYLAVDIGASGGRHILGTMEHGKMRLEEVYRFENGMKKQDGKLVWDVKHLFSEILNGMKRCKEIGRIPVSMSIDTWAVDYVLLDENDEVLGDTYGYRDSRTDGMDKKVYERISEKELYEKTGIQKQTFNTIYQLMAAKQQTPHLLEKARTFLMLPDYFQFLLTGVKASEYTNATTTQLVSPVSKQWDRALIAQLGYPDGMFLELKAPGTPVGNLRDEIQKEVGFCCAVVLCASHDTASAVMAVPAAEASPLYISSGTWSLMGVESETVRCDENSRLSNFTNEGGYHYRFRYLKNIMGLWMIQSVRRETGGQYSFARLCEMAEENSAFPSRVDVNDACFLSPENMTREIRESCARTGQPRPESIGEVAAVVYHSLADCYGRTVKEIEANTGRAYDKIRIIGGGSHAAYLNRLTAHAAQKTVYAGPAEATAIGNLMAQMIKGGELKDLAEARRCVGESFEIQAYHKN